MEDLQIDLLADHPAAIPVLRAEFEREWAPYYGSTGPGNALDDLRASCQRDTLPLALVALSGESACGTAALKEESILTHTHLKPWLSALLVLPGFQCRGVGRRLISAIEDAARALGHPQIYAGTGVGPGNPASLLRKQGWRFVERGPYFAGDILIFTKTLSRSTGTGCRSAPAPR